MSDSYDPDDTIAAQATAREPGYERGIIRVSGTKTRSVIGQSFESTIPLESVRSARSVPGNFQCNDLSLPVPVDILYWPSAKSYTKQVSAEIHTIGSQPILAAILERLCQNGARLAGPGEFTLRAFLSGRMDLTAAEAVLGVIDAKDRKQLNVALDQLAGGIAKPLEVIRTELISTLANLEAGLDFVEEDIEFVSQAGLLEMIQRGIHEIESLRSQIKYRDGLESTFRVVLAGRPNTGKSSLFNALVNQFGQSDRRAIVSEQSGTTRDFVSGQILLHGHEVTLIDTAGIDRSADFQNPGSVSTALSDGQNKGVAQQSTADLEIFCIDQSQPLTDWELDKLKGTNAARIICLNKLDLGQASLLASEYPTVSTSSLTGEGISTLAERITRAINHTVGDSVAGTAIRCAESVESALTALQNAKEMVAVQVGDEFVASEIRLALDAIGKITGKIYTDDILDVVFKQFCIGK